MPADTYESYGAPRAIWVSVGISEDTLDFKLYMVNKTSTRLPEALFVSFNPDIDTNSGGEWTLMKSGEDIDPLDIAVNGSCHLHSLDTTQDWNAAYSLDSGYGFYINSLDVPLASVGFANPFPIPLSPQDSIDGGVAFNIFNNIWGTNYPQWLPFAAEDTDITTVYRFTIVVE